MEKENKTGLPDGLGARDRCLSGCSMDDIKVHYNSDHPAVVAASAYAQGTDYKLAPGREQHLAHEPSHVVQQRPGRIRPQAEMENEPKPPEHP